MEIQGWGSLLMADVERSAALDHGCDHEVAELDENFRPTGVWVGCSITRRDPVDGSLDLQTADGDVVLGVRSNFVRLAHPYECDHGCGFRGSYEAVSEHEASCVFIPPEPAAQPAAQLARRGAHEASERRRRSSVRRTLTAAQRLTEARDRDSDDAALSHRRRTAAALSLSPRGRGRRVCFENAPTTIGWGVWVAEPTRMDGSRFGRCQRHT